MSSKFRVSFDIDVSQIAPEILRGPNAVEPAVVQEVVLKMFVREARRATKERLHGIRRDELLDADAKVVAMAEEIRRMMLTLMAEANMSVEVLPASTPISTELPYERKHEPA